MNPAYKSSLPVVLDPVAAAIIAQLKQTIADQTQQVARFQQALATSEMRAQKLEEELRLERIRKYGKQSEKLSDLQLQLLDLEPAVSSDEIKAEIAARYRNRPRATARPTRSGEVTRITRAATSCPRIWNG